MVRVWRNLAISTSHSRPLTCIYLVLKDLQERIFHRFLQEPILIFQQIFLIFNPNPSCQHLGPSLSSVPCINGEWLVLLIKYTYSCWHSDFAGGGNGSHRKEGRNSVQPSTSSGCNMQHIRDQALSPWTLPGSREYSQEYSLGLPFILEPHQAI